MTAHYPPGPQRLVVCLEESLYIHNIRDMKLIHTIRDTPANPRGVCALSVNSDLSYLAYPGSASIGELQVFDALNLVSWGGGQVRVDVGLATRHCDTEAETYLILQQLHYFS